MMASAPCEQAADAVSIDGVADLSANPEPRCETGMRKIAYGGSMMRLPPRLYCYRTHHRAAGSCAGGGAPTRDLRTCGRLKS